MFGLNEDDYKKIFSIDPENDIIIPDDCYTLMMDSPTTTNAQLEESVDDIRKNAPNWFKMGNRLMTRSDYEYFVKSELENVLDVRCMNNWEYLASFYKWLYTCGIKYHQDAENPGRYYFEENRFVTYGIDEVDAADANNIYLWIKPKVDESTASIKQNLINCGIDNLKIMTSEIQVLTPVTVMFDICAAYQDVGQIFAAHDNFDEFQ